MNIKKVSPRLFVSGQISVNDAGAAAAQGIRTIICNRPDCETADQPDTSEIAQAAFDAGMEFVHIPVLSNSITDANVTDFAAACKNAEGPILAYCRSGKRSISLWALGEAASLRVDAILATTGEAGYDLTGLEARLVLRAEL